MNSISRPSPIRTICPNTWHLKMIPLLPFRPFFTPPAASSDNSTASLLQALHRELNNQMPPWAIASHDDIRFPNCLPTPGTHLFPVGRGSGGGASDMLMADSHPSGEDRSVGPTVMAANTDQEKNI